MDGCTIPWSVVNVWNKLSPSAKSVAVAVGAFIAEGWRGVSREEIASRAGLRTAKAVSKATWELQCRGLLIVRRRPNLSALYGWREELPPDPFGKGVGRPIRCADEALNDLSGIRPLRPGELIQADDASFLRAVAVEEQAGEWDADA
jgi:hypothetical protein